MDGETEYTYMYLDVKKALDKVPHTKSIWKSENIGGLKVKIKEWMKD